MGTILGMNPGILLLFSLKRRRFLHTIIFSLGKMSQEQSSDSDYDDDFVQEHCPSDMSPIIDERVVNISKEVLFPRRQYYFAVLRTPSPPPRFAVSPKSYQPSSPDRSSYAPPASISRRYAAMQPAQRHPSCPSSPVTEGEFFVHKEHCPEEWREEDLLMAQKFNVPTATTLRKEIEAAIADGRSSIISPLPSFNTKVAKKKKNQEGSQPPVSPPPMSRSPLLFSSPEKENQPPSLSSSPSPKKLRYDLL